MQKMLNLLISVFGLFASFHACAEIATGAACEGVKVQQQQQVVFACEGVVWKEISRAGASVIAVSFRVERDGRIESSGVGETFEGSVLAYVVASRASYLPAWIADETIYGLALTTVPVINRDGSVRLTVVASQHGTKVAQMRTVRIASGEDVVVRFSFSGDANDGRLSGNSEWVLTLRAEKV